MANATPMRGDRAATPPTGAPDVADLKRELEALRRHTRAFEQHARALQAEIEALQAAREDQAREIADIRASTSWRLTAPLRAAVTLLRRRGGAAPSEAPDPAPAVAETPATPAPEPPPGALDFPLDGAVAVPGELAEAPPAALDARVSVVIPTLNAGPEFHWLVRKLLSQKGLAGVELIVVDSGSTDGTPELATAAGAVVVRIPHETFDHSHARNLGADAASGDLLLFTVQDAYPIGDWWLASLARALLEPASEAERLSAVSCSEFPRSDSDFYYNAVIDIHYRFLGCRDSDRIGWFQGEAQDAIHTQGQLSDVACMIPASIFQAYRYRGRYAEDLLLGMRMIRDGRRLGLLSSVQVAHSHNRPATYHLKRTFVDVLFMRETFADFTWPYTDCLTAGLAAAAAIEPLVRAWRPEIGDDCAASLRELAERVRRTPLTCRRPPPGLDFGLPPLGAWIAAAVAAEGREAAPEAEPIRNMIADRLAEIAAYAERTVGEADERLAEEIGAAARKAFAAVVGAQLCYFYLSYAAGAPEPLRGELAALRGLMLAGV